MLVLALILAFLAVIVVRALLFRPLPQKPVANVPVTVNAEKVVSDMRDMVRCKTVSGQYPEDFEAFRALLRERFPLIHKACTLHHLGETGLLYHLAGHSHDCPAVCMAH